MKKKHNEELFYSTRLIKPLIVLKTSLTLLIMGMFHSYGSNDSQFAQITVKLEKESLIEVFETIERQSDFIVIYRQDIIDPNIKVNISLESTTVDKILDQALKNTGLDYKILDRQVIIFKKETQKETRKEIQQEKILIQGKITDKESGKPLPGVNVLVKGSTTGTVTDLEGEYSITVADNNATLLFSYVGFISEQVTVGSRTNISLWLVPDITGLGELIVVGYGVQKKSDVTGAIASVSGDELNNIPTAGVDEALQGKAAGVFVNSNSGAPGSGVNIFIRGIGSINGAPPLYIIDGSQSTAEAFSALNPRDIKSIEILKDASSIAIYGSGGGNGVILVSTKDGKQGKMQTEFDYYFGLQQPGKKIDLANTAQYISIFEELYPKNRIFDTLHVVDTDWQKEVFEPASMQKISLGVSGGNEQADYRFSVGYFTQDGTLRGSSFERYTIGLKSNYKLNKRIELGTNFNLANSVHHGNIDNWIFNTWFSPISQTLQMHPIVEPYDSTGKWNRSPMSNVRNPLVQIDNSNNTRPNYRVFGNISLGFELLKGLKYKTMFGGNLSFNHNRELVPVFNYAPDFQNLTSTLTRYNDRYYNWNWQHILIYEKSFGQHDFTLMGGFESGYSLYEWTRGTRYNLINESPEMHYFNASLENETILLDGSGEDNASYSYFGRINYSIKGKYLFTSNIRRDASSKFGPDYREGLFPSFSLGWKFSGEEFANNLGFLSFGKIRAGWGKSGNSNIRPYSYYSTITTTSTFGYGIDNQKIPAVGAAPIGIPNRELHWEALVGSNIGIDLAFFQNKLSLTADYFVKENEGMLIPKPVPAIAGTYQQAPAYEGGSATMLANLGSIKNEGFEVSLGLKSNVGNFNHNFNLNFTYVTNVVGKIGGDTILTGPEAIGEKLNFTAQNEPMGSFYGYVTDGLFRPDDAELINGVLVVTNQPFFIDDKGTKKYAQPRAQPGDLKFKDLNQDGKLTADDRAIIGNPHPKLLVGFAYNLGYKNWDLQLFFQGAFGHQIYNYTKSWLYNSSGRYNWAADATERYRTPVYDANNNLIDPGNTTSDQFRFDIRNLNNNYRASDYYVEDGDYIRLKNIQLGYSLPESLTQKAGITSARLYFGIKDLLTLTKYSGFDPEILSGGDPLVAGVDFGSYPRPRVYTFGTNIKF